MKKYTIPNVIIQCIKYTLNMEKKKFIIIIKDMELKIKTYFKKLKIK